MRFYGVAAILCGLILVAAGGCGYLPSEMTLPGQEKKSGRNAHASVASKPHTVGCSEPAKGYQLVRFKDLYTVTGNANKPFREAKNVPTQFDVKAYVWGSDNCSRSGSCAGGDHFWLIGRGPGNDFKTWVVTPQFPRLTIQSSCRDKLKVGERFRFSFSHGKLVGFSK